ncbi:MAG: N-acetyl-gamma-glutamyl-phosphate reductase [Acidobacteria bacterium]|nr:N-acetyl-gamma-glutamyl-phosphate reductase [Acidobacteriota bacterium]
MNLRAGIVGFRGYSGAELVRILEHHPNAEPVLLEHRSDSEDRPLPRGHKGPARAPATAEAVKSEGLAVVFLATPHDVAMQLAGPILDAGARVVDLSAAFRLGNGASYLRWYKEEHTAQHLFAQAVYSIPELHRDQARNARLIANPGCYPTAASLALAPLARAGVIHRAAGVICDAKSGVSGAGRKPSLKTSFCEVTENFSAYSILDHRHVPEVLMNTGLEEAQFSFTAQLLPTHRGILETIYFRAPGISSAAALLDIYEQAYANEPFIRLYDPGKVPDLAAIQRTNFCDIGLKFDPATGRAVVVAAIDNLVKGAAGQAVQNMNLALGLPETAGL